jgi:hypothetical protein
MPSKPSVKLPRLSLAFSVRSPVGTGKWGPSPRPSPRCAVRCAGRGGRGKEGTAPIPFAWSWQANFRATPETVYAGDAVVPPRPIQLVRLTPGACLATEPARTRVFLSLSIQVPRGIGASTTNRRFPDESGEIPRQMATSPCRSCRVDAEAAPARPAAAALRGRKSRTVRGERPLRALARGCVAELCRFDIAFGEPPP